MCTGIKVTANNGDIFWGRTMDLAIGMFGEDADAGRQFPSSIVTYPKGIEIKGTIDTWQSKHAVIGMGIDDTRIMYDGVNDVGLAGDVQVLMECSHDSQANITGRGQKPVTGEEFVTFILSQYETVQEIRDMIHSVALSDDTVTVQDMQLSMPLHYSFIDESGDGIVLEPIHDGSFVVHDFMGTMTNSPTYDWHLMNLNNYIGMGTIDLNQSHALNDKFTFTPIETGTGYSMFGMPGDYTSVSRFVRAAFISNNLDSFTADKGINALYTAFRSVIVPRGLEHPNAKTTITDYTRYWSGYHITNRTVYVQTCEALTIFSKTIDPNLTQITYTPVPTQDQPTPL
jgi:choloylglycine hydrolase